ncbi:hypothetical protein C8D88_12724 [Lentzea atacamensis]|uniref:Uncharacterized protein n=1 Tax=Lentzea atacamensis TaxID=531938 RepID=A0A316HK14_9PSEU|nr:hypothetical protein C8D88_12724 [Lentzea atacamensis]
MRWSFSLAGSHDNSGSCFGRPGTDVPGLPAIIQPLDESGSASPPGLLEPACGFTPVWPAACGWRGRLCRVLSGARPDRWTRAAAPRFRVPPERACGFVPAWPWPCDWPLGAARAVGAHARPCRRMWVAVPHLQVRSNLPAGSRRPGLRGAVRRLGRAACCRGLSGGCAVAQPLNPNGSALLRGSAGTCPQVHSGLAMACGWPPRSCACCRALVSDARASNCWARVTVPHLRARPNLPAGSLRPSFSARWPPGCSACCRSPVSVAR